MLHVIYLLSAANVNAEQIYHIIKDSSLLSAISVWVVEQSYYSS